MIQNSSIQYEFKHLWTNDVYIRACKFLPPKGWTMYIYVLLVLAKRWMPFIYAKVLNGVLLDFGKHQSRGFQPGGRNIQLKGKRGKRISSASG